MAAGTTYVVDLYGLKNPAAIETPTFMRMAAGNFVASKEQYI